MRGARLVTAVAALALLALVTAGCTQPAPRAFAFEVQNEGSVLFQGDAYANATSGRETRSYSVAPGVTMRFTMTPPADAFTFEATARAATGSAVLGAGPTPVDLTACQGTTIVPFAVQAGSGTAGVRPGSPRCEA